MNTTEDERFQVLRMVEAGQLSASDAIEILDLLRAASVAPPAAALLETAAPPKHLRVRVTDLVTGQEKVDMTLPWSLAAVGMSMGARFTPHGIDLDLNDLLQAVEQGGGEKVMEVEDEEEAERVEIFVE